MKKVLFSSNPTVLSAYGTVEPVSDTRAHM